MPAMMGLQFINRCPHIAGAARSYGVIVLNLTALPTGVEQVQITSLCYEYRQRAI
ncbi:MAG: hypothetical protein ACXWT1_13055 [Methylobacter sp.]